MTADNVSSALLEWRRDDRVEARLHDVAAALRLWRRSLIAEMVAAEDIPDTHNTETLLDLLHGELQECAGLMNATHKASERIRDRRTAEHMREGLPI